ncbi:hypothetical protein RX330_20475 [Bradyrhizobium sp. NDS-1]|uniref:hypothetical protein n=1 Tax=Bradyrhizobium sp. NDS-1 TaxID=3080014 RepID=UPI00293EB4B0|nr:hypothetical protein [Bradyrhizobium sp. NDS-1]WOH70675.1 hypothetical protein RX330_20475 [Bradyrhizobium sp. NDS-1]
MTMIVSASTLALAQPAGSVYQTPDAELIALGQQLDAFAHRLATSEAKWAEDTAPNWEHPDDILTEAGPVCRAILAAPARTVAGLAVKARLAAFGAPTYWQKSDEDADWDILVMRQLVESVIHTASAGV